MYLDFFFSVSVCQHLLPKSRQNLSVMKVYGIQTCLEVFFFYQRICNVQVYGICILTRILNLNFQIREVWTLVIYTAYHLFFCFCCWGLRYHAIHKEVYDWFGISFDKFGRTSTPEQTEVCQAIFNKLWDNKWLSENTMQQVNAFTPMPVRLI